jgi:hypothetical protein
MERPSKQAEPDRVDSHPAVGSQTVALHPFAANLISIIVRAASVGLNVHHNRTSETA